MKLFLTNLGETKILIFFLPLSCLFLSPNPSLKKAFLISSRGTGKNNLFDSRRYTEIMSLEDGPCRGIFNAMRPSERQLLSKRGDNILKEKVRR